MVRTSRSWRRPSSSRAERILGPYPAAGMCARLPCLIEPFHALASGDHHGNRQIQRVVQALDGCYRSTLEEVSVPHRFHAEHGDSLLDEFGQYLLRKAAVPEVRALSRVALPISVAAWVWVAFALAPRVHRAGKRKHGRRWNPTVDRIVDGRSLQKPQNAPIRNRCARRAGSKHGK